MNRHRQILQIIIFGGPNILLSIVVLIPILSGAFYIDHNLSPRKDEWSYSKQMEWHHYFPTCGDQSKRQSPINIKRENVITNYQLTMKFFNYNRRIKFNIMNAHHTNKQSEYGSSQSFDINTVDEAEPSSYSNTLAKDGSRQLQHNTIDRNHEINHNTIYNSNDDTQNLQHQQHLKLQHDATNAHNNKRSSLYNSNFANSNNSSSSSSRIINSVSSNQTSSQLSLDLNNNNNSTGNNINSSDASTSVENDNDPEGNKQRLPYDGVPMIKLDWMDEQNNEYKLHDIHFHWGTSKDNGSEHLIDSRKSAMEMHLVHIKKGLKKDQIGYNSDSVVVIAVLIESYRKSNANLNPIVNTLTSINMSDVSHVIDYGAINDLLPNDRNKFYTYAGSLTTPPCFEVVNWIVMHERVYINAKQMEMFRNIYARMDHGNKDDEHQQGSEVIYKIMPNIRQRQATRGRPIMASFALSNNNNNNNMIQNELDSISASGTIKSTFYESLLIILLTLVSLSVFRSYLNVM